MAKDVLIENLNPQQKEAVLYNDGPILVLAGAGSGKTRVITHKFAYLVKKKKLPSSSIFTVTFTNKAADEMKERINAFFVQRLKQTWIGTFHSLCSRILRMEIDALGYKNDFSIYDEEEKASLIKQILKDFNIHEALYKGVCNKISLLKSALISPEDFLSSNNGYSFDEKLGRVYLKYQDELKRYNALDFDDLILLTIQLFENYPSILKKYHDTFSYILVDEFQDTSQSQYLLIKFLASPHKNICVVGDDDQSIYRFRGASVQNILNFKKDFSNVKIIKLEQNYRSTQNILNVSNHLISKNLFRSDKKLWTQKCSGERVFYCRLSNEQEEAKYVARSIKDLYLKSNYEYRDFAILYRINIQSKALEDALRAESIPYHIISGISFYQRKEVKDLISFLKVIMNPDDNVSLIRVINSFYRGIGAATISKLELEAKNLGLSLYATIKALIKSNKLTLSLKNKLNDLITSIDSISSQSNKRTTDLLKEIVEKTDYVNKLDDKKLQNLLELISSAENTSLTEFLDKISLISSADDSPKGNSVSLVTLHNAKGLEFPVVFIVGLEDGILPYFKAIDDREDLQEERRLLYVGMTRARDYLCLTGAKRRKLFAKFQDFEPSRFLADIPRECCDWVERIQATIDNKEDETVNSQPSSTTYTLNYKIGTKVKHPVWGIGIIRDCYGEGENKKVMINFPGFGIKRLALKFANLQTMN